MASTPALRCPRDGVLTKLQAFESAGGPVEIDICPSCTGFWLDVGELARLTDAQLEKEIFARVIAINSKVRCPKCGSEMRVSEYEGVQVDVCRAWCGIWVDRDEFNLLGQRFIAAVKAGKHSMVGPGDPGQRAVGEAIREAKMKEEIREKAKRGAAAGSGIPEPRLPPLPPLGTPHPFGTGSSSAKTSLPKVTGPPIAKVDSKLDKDYLVMRIDDGSDLHASIEEACRRHYVKSGMILMGIGQARNFELGFLDEHGKYLREVFPDIHEVLSLQGSVAQDEGKHHIHVHGVFSDREHRARGGHVFKAETRTMCEVTIVSVYGLKRKTLPSGVKCTVFS